MGISSILIVIAIIGVRGSECGLARQYTYSSYKAAVYEHGRRPRLPHESPRQYMRHNLNVYEKQIIAAKQQDVDVIVFPEYGVTGFVADRDAFLPYLQHILPARVGDNVCTRYTSTSASWLLHRISCLARANQMLVVLNLGEVVYCSSAGSLHCPPDGRYQYNTNVMFNQTGHLVMLHRKCQLFYERPTIDKPERCDASVYDAGFAKFGMVTCFDFFFSPPMLELIEQRGVTAIVMSVALSAYPPLLHPLQLFAGFANHFHITLLAANIYRYDDTVADGKLGGSGIFTGSNTFIHTSQPVSEHSSGQLLILVTPSQMVLPQHTQHFGCDKQIYVVSDGNGDGFNMTFLGDIYNYKSLKPALLTHHSNESSIVTSTVCQNKLCCAIKLKTKQRLKRSTSEAYGAYKLVVFKGVTNYSGTPWSYQYCAVIKEYSDNFGAQRVIYNWFASIELSGNFSTKYVMPSVMASGNTVVPLPHTVHTSPRKIISLSGDDIGDIQLLSLFGRWFENDT